MKQKFCKSILCLMLALVCLLTGCNVTLSSSITTLDYIEAIVPEGLKVDFYGMGELKEAMENNPNGGYFLVLDAHSGKSEDRSTESFTFNVNTDSKKEFANAISTSLFTFSIYHDSYFDDPEEERPGHTFEYIYTCYETDSYPESFYFTHHKCNIEERYDKILSVHDQNGKVLANLAYKIKSKYRVPTNEYMEEFITNNVTVLKGGIIPHPDDVDKQYLYRFSAITFSPSIVSSSHTIETIQDVATKNESCFAIIRPNENSNSKYTINYGNFSLIKNEQNQPNIFMSRTSFYEKVQIEKDGEVEVYNRAMPFSFRYASYELKSIPTSLRFEHCFLDWVVPDRNRVIFVYDQNDNLVLEICYGYNYIGRYLFPYYGIYCGDQYVEDLIKENLIFIKGE